MEKIDIEIKDKLGKGNLFKIAPFKEKIKKTRPHKHDGYFELIFLEQAEGFHWVDTDHFQVRAPEIYFLKPGRLHCWQFTAIPRGFVVLFKETYFNILREADLVELLHSLQSEARVALPADYQPRYLFEAMWREYREGRPHADQVIHGLLHALLSKLKQLLELREKGSPQPMALHERFLQLLATRNRPLPTVRAYAKLLALDAADTLDFLRVPPSNRLEQLRGDRDGQWSVRINAQWRLCFRWDGRDAYDAEITDYQIGRAHV